MRVMLVHTGQLQDTWGFASLCNHFVQKAWAYFNVHTVSLNSKFSIKMMFADFWFHVMHARATCLYYEGKVVWIVQILSTSSRLYLMRRSLDEVRIHVPDARRQTRCWKSESATESPRPPCNITSAPTSTSVHMFAKHMFAHVHVMRVVRASARWM